MGGIERASRCIGLRGPGNSGPESFFDPAHVHKWGSEREKIHDEDRGGRRAWESRFVKTTIDWRFPIIFNFLIEGFTCTFSFTLCA